MRTINKSLVVIVAALLCGCMNNHADEYADREAEQAERNARRASMLQEDCRICEMECNGHLYVIASKYHVYAGVAMLHSPNCPCHKGGEE